MDKRTLFLVFALTITFYIVNSFFEGQRLDERQEWYAQQKTKKEKEVQLLEQEISDQKVTAKDLPLMEVYADAAGSKFITSGVYANDSLLTLSWEKELPDTVYVRKANTTDRTEAYTLAFTPHQQNAPAIFQKGKEHQMPISSLPYFGKFPVQLVTLFPNDQEHPVSVTLGQYYDGRLIFPEEELERLKAEVNDSYESKQITVPGNAIVIAKTDGKYLPMSVYLKETDSMILLEQVEGLAALTKKPFVSSPITNGEEKFYVLQNNYQQLVFSNKGAALAEINLPFRTEENRNSVVKEIGFDRDMVEDHPYNALFPGNPYYTAGESPQGPFVEHPEGQLGGFYPLLRRDLIMAQNRETINILPGYNALNIVSEYPEMAELIYTVKHFDDHQITFEAQQRHRRITKTFTLPKEGEGAPYIIDLTIQIEGDSRGLWLTTGVPEAEWISNGPAPTLKYRITKNQKSTVETVSLPKESDTINQSIYPDWLCNSNGFLGMILDPLTKIDPGYRARYVSGTTAPSRLIEIDQQYDRFQAQKLPGYMMMMPLSVSGGTMKFRFFAGPFATELLKRIDAFYQDPATGYTPDFIAAQSSHGWFTFISAPFSKLLLFLMNMFHNFTDSWGLSIILLTVALRLMLYPLNAWSAKSMLRMQEIQPEQTAIQEKYKKDPKRVQMEIMNLYREKGVNPLSGCFPLLIQMPFLIGMFDLLKSTFELRGASFIPGWIDNLAAPDVLFSWDYPLWFVGTEFHLLPILSGIVMFVQQRFMSAGPSDPSKMTEQQRQQKMMGTIMPVFLMFIFYNFPSGLNIYFLSSSILGILQQWITKKTMKPSPSKGTVEVLPKPGKKKNKAKSR